MAAIDIVDLVKSNIYYTIVVSGQEPDHCMAIDYTQEGNGRLEGAPTCMTIVGAIRVAAPLPVSALILCMVAVILHSIGSIHGDRKTLIAASLYILSGLSLAVGIVLYISAINDEVGYRSSKRAEQTFVYNYGWSFYTAGIAFITSEMAAVVCVTLFLQRHMKVDDLEKLVPGLHLKIRSRRYSRRNYYSDCHQTLII
ncbi:hypothetical protein SNE40_005393 [Patella caerulea]|uniref:Uncharacterized protein n=1 Tax=Patella caerulea TaxID=87958 RepID=A0AAN8JWW5_PATCE